MDNEITGPDGSFCNNGADQIGRCYDGGCVTELPPGCGTKVLVAPVDDSEAADFRVATGSGRGACGAASTHLTTYPPLAAQIPDVRGDALRR